MHAKAKFDERRYNRPKRPDNFGFLIWRQSWIIEIGLIAFYIDLNVVPELCRGRLVYGLGQIGDVLGFDIFHDEILIVLGRKTWPRPHEGGALWHVSYFDFVAISPVAERERCIAARNAY